MQQDIDYVALILSLLEDENTPDHLIDNMVNGMRGAGMVKDLIQYGYDNDLYNLKGSKE